MPDGLKKGETFVDCVAGSDATLMWQGLYLLMARAGDSD